jgi:serine phosphatase RsbU (regulator of sigma subunit)
VLLSLLLLHRYNQQNEKLQMIRDFGLLAKSVGANNTAAIRFNKKNAALESLGIFRANNQVEIASIIDLSGFPFVEYFANEKRIPYRIPFLMKNQEMFTDTHLEMVRSIEVDGLVFGYIYLRVNLENLEQQSNLNVQIALLVIFIAMVFTFVIAAQLVKPITAPIRKLAEFARAFGNLKDYSLRVAHDKSTVEIADMYQAFNAMLAEIQSQNHELKTAFEIVSLQKEEIKQKNHDIQDSINSASRLQNLMLPDLDTLGVYSKDLFVFFEPKDTLSGDFYWFAKKGELIFLAAVDCVGHGIPGAMLSIIAHNLLTKFIMENDVHNPAMVLNRLDASVRETNIHSETRSARMMDIALCVIDLKHMTLQYSGAYSPLYLVRNQELIELAADKAAIGTLREHELPSFSNQCFQIQQHDMLYLFSDGIVDQFGGKNNKKFKYPALRRMLLEMSDESIASQAFTIENNFHRWCGLNDQVDDVLVMGYRIDTLQADMVANRQSHISAKKEAN